DYYCQSYDSALSAQVF
nr:immunoglobulin light chain junction region [Macaca mulatta]MOX80455.1 immunoglobulin light chain junction region [Macaca mulatta]MOX80642.1 immunoglobulin light chain junction region [Macaca mulatta]MOX81206.1 immunoglobulin light chain junction region [Macaca mulatta]MOX81341.1 immunoglobulin light chain junction region [Macaca mulatta]